jgi:hypothetical protein
MQLVICLADERVREPLDRLVEDRNRQKLPRLKSQRATRGRNGKCNMKQVGETSRYRHNGLAEENNNKFISYYLLDQQPHINHSNHLSHTYSSFSFYESHCPTMLQIHTRELVYPALL